MRCTMVKGSKLRTGDVVLFDEFRIPLEKLVFVSNKDRVMRVYEDRSGL